MGVVGVERGVELLEAEQHGEKSLWLYQPALVFSKMHLNILDIIKSMMFQDVYHSNGPRVQRLLYMQIQSSPPYNIRGNNEGFQSSASG